MIRVNIPDTDLGQICDSGQCFRMYRIEEGAVLGAPGGNEFEIIAADKYVRVAKDGEDIIFSCDEAQYREFWKNYFDVTTDYGAIKALADESDTFMLSAIEKGSGIRILKQDLWEMIVTFLISQQNNIPRIHKCVENVCRKYGEKKTNFLGDDYYAFPTVESLAVLPEDALMECNLGYRSKYVVRTAREIMEGKYNLSAISGMNYEDAYFELMKMFGVGKKVADCICLFALHHINAFPIDTHIRQVIDREYNGVFPFEKYEGYLGIMQQYIFFADLKTF